MSRPLLRVICAVVFMVFMSAYAQGLYWVDAQAGHVATLVVGAATIGALLLVLKPKYRARHLVSGRLCHSATD